MSNASNYFLAERGAELLARGDDFDEARAVRALIDQHRALTPVYFVKSFVSPSGWIECTQYDYTGHVSAGFVTRILYDRTTPTQEPK